MLEDALDAENGSQKSPLVMALESRRIGKVKSVCAAGADTNKTTDHILGPQAPTFYVTRQVENAPQGRILSNLLGVLLDHGADPKGGWSADRFNHPIGNMFFLLETCNPNDARRRRSLTIQIISILNRYAQHNNSTLSGFLPTNGGFTLEEVRAMNQEATNLNMNVPDLHSTFRARRSPEKKVGSSALQFVVSEKLHSHTSNGGRSAQSTVKELGSTRRTLIKDGHAFSLGVHT